MGFLDKLKELASKNKGAVDSAIDKAGDIVDQKTQGKYTQQVDKAQDAAKNAVDKTPPQIGDQTPLLLAGAPHSVHSGFDLSSTPKPAMAIDDLRSRLQAAA